MRQEGQRAVLGPHLAGSPPPDLFEALRTGGSALRQQLRMNRWWTAPDVGHGDQALRLSGVAMLLSGRSAIEKEYHR